MNPRKMLSTSYPQGSINHEIEKHEHSLIYLPRCEGVLKCLKVDTHPITLFSLCDRDLCEDLTPTVKQNLARSGRYPSLKTVFERYNSFNLQIVPLGIFYFVFVSVSVSILKAEFEQC